jgi:hypothetical protein
VTFLFAALQHTLSGQQFKVQPYPLTFYDLNGPLICHPNSASLPSALTLSYRITLIVLRGAKMKLNLRENDSYEIEKGIA